MALSNLLPKSLAFFESRLKKIESFLALKYGITLGINGTSLDYINSAGTTTWGQSSNSGYNYDITGIGRDDNGNLDHTKTHSTNSTGGRAL